MAHFSAPLRRPRHPGSSPQWPSPAAPELSPSHTARILLVRSVVPLPMQQLCSELSPALTRSILRHRKAPENSTAITRSSLIPMACVVHVLASPARSILATVLRLTQSPIQLSRECESLVRSSSILRTSRRRRKYRHLNQNLPRSYLNSRP